MIQRLIAEPYSVLQCGAVWCIMSQYVALCCSVVHCGAVWCSEFQRAAECCSALHRIIIRRIGGYIIIRRPIVARCSALQRVAACCSVLEYVAVCCSVL